MPTVTRAMFAAINSLISPRAQRTVDPTPTDPLVTEVQSNQFSFDSLQRNVDPSPTDPLVTEDESNQFYTDSLPDRSTIWDTLDTRLQHNESTQRQMKEDQTTILQLLHALAANQVLASPTTAANQVLASPTTASIQVLAPPTTVTSVTEAPVEPPVDIQNITSRHKQMSRA